MKNKKCLRKFINLAIILAMLIIVAGCGRADEPPPADAAPDTRLSAQADTGPSAHEYSFALESARTTYGAAMHDAEDFLEFEEQTLSEIGSSAPGYTEEAPPQTGNATPGTQAPSPLGVDLMQRMIIRSASMAINTLYYQSTITGIEQIVANRGGFIETSRQWMTHCPYAGMLWRAEYVIRVPVGLFDTTNNELTALGPVRYFSTASHDATHEFNDLGSRLQIREAEETRVARMLEEATELSDIISLEARLTNLRLVIDAYRRRREEIDHLATFSTINLSVFEVIEIQEIGDEEEDDEDDYPIMMISNFGQRIGNAFSASANVTAQALEMIAIFIAVIILPGGLLALSLLLIYLVAKKLSGNNRLLKWLKP